MAKTTSKKATKAKATKSSGRNGKRSGNKDGNKRAARPAIAAKSSKKGSKPSVKVTAKARTTPAGPPRSGGNSSKSTAQTPKPRPGPGLPPPANFKPGKNQAGLHKRDLDFFRDLLVAKRRELLGDVHSMEQEALRAGGGSNLSNLPIHMADMGTDNYEQEFTLGLVEKDRQLLREINAALGKIQDGTYGICEGTGKPISRARLEVQPWARFSIEHARQMEKGFIRGAI